MYGFISAFLLKLTKQQIHIYKVFYFCSCALYNASLIIFGKKCAKIKKTFQNKVTFHVIYIDFMFMWKLFGWNERKTNYEYIVKLCCAYGEISFFCFH